MSQSFSSKPTLQAAGQDSGMVPHYELHSDLAQYCLPQSSYDPNRRYAWANSICAITLLIGFLGFYVPKMAEKPLPEILDVVPIVFTPPVEPPKVLETTPEEQPDDSKPPSIDQPAVATVVAANPAAAAFAVPVSGPVVFAPVERASAPPVVQRRSSAPSKPIVFSGVGRAGFPKPPYPSMALRRGVKGEVVLLVTVSAEGDPVEVVVQQSSGSSLLDEPSVKWVQANYRWEKGNPCQYLVMFEYRPL